MHLVQPIDIGNLEYAKYSCRIKVASVSASAIQTLTAHYRYLGIKSYYVYEYALIISIWWIGLRKLFSLRNYAIGPCPRRTFFDLSEYSRRSRLSLQISNFLSTELKEKPTKGYRPMIFRADVTLPVPEPLLINLTGHPPSLSKSGHERQAQQGPPDDNR